MKTRLLAIPIVLVCLMFNVQVSAQQKQKELTFGQRSEVNAIREQYIRAGIPYREAEQRALAVFESEQQISIRSRLMVPPTKSVQINRDPDNLANPHPVYNTATAEDLVREVLLSDPAAQSRITNINFTGNIGGVNRSLAYFENGDALGIERGLILGTGNILYAEGGNASPSLGNLNGGTGNTGDFHLGPIAAPWPVNDVVILEFDFQPYMSEVTFDFIFASEEYPEFSNGTFNDVFGFFVWEVGAPLSYRNIALFPDGTPVTINNSNWGNWGVANTQTAFPAPLGDAVNPQWHVPNYEDNVAGSDSIMEYDGRTVKLQAVADNLDPSKTYTLKLAICNVTDNACGSAVFLANLDLGKAQGTAGGPLSETGVSDIDDLGLDDEGELMFLYGNRPCTYPMKLTFDNTAASTYAIVDIDYISETDRVFPASALQNLEGKQLFSVDTIQLNGVQDTVHRYDFKISTDCDEFVNGQYVGITVSVRGSGLIDTVFYRRLFDTLSWDLDYRMMTEIDKGYLNLNVAGGTPYVYRSLNGGSTWKPISIGFSERELLYIGEECDILLYQPFQCCFDTIKIRRATDTPVIQRYVDIPSVPGVMTEPKAGKHYVRSFEDFSFTVQYAGDPLSVRAEGYYSKMLLDLDKTAELQLDGSYKYTMYKLVEPWTLHFVSKSNSGDVSNEMLNGRSVWSNGNTLYLDIQGPCLAKIYTLTGLLYKQVEVDGTTSLQLPQGFFIVSVNGKQYKVMIK